MLVTLIYLQMALMPNYNYLPYYDSKYGESYSVTTGEEPNKPRKEQNIQRTKKTTPRRGREKAPNTIPEYATITAYSELETCPNRACTMASGKIAYIGAVACPRAISFGTKVFIEGYGEFTCEDRTHKRFDGRYDIFMGYGEEGYAKAIKFGKKKLKIHYDSSTTQHNRVSVNP